MAELRTVVNFKEDCVDPLAKLVMLEAMSFAVEKAESRLESLGKIFPGLEVMGVPIIQDIKDIRFSIESMNVCSIPPSGGPTSLPPTPPPPPAAIKAMGKREQELVKAMPENLQTALAMHFARQEGETVTTPDFWVKGKPVSESKAQRQRTEKEELEEAAKKTRTQPTSWGRLEYKSIPYSSPGAFLAGLHGGDVKAIRGQGNYLKQLDKEGFDVFIGGKKIDPGLDKDSVEKLKEVAVVSGLRVELRKGVIKPTPPSDIEVPLSLGSVGIYPLKWSAFHDEAGKLLYFKDAKGVVVPPTIWQKFDSKQLDSMTGEDIKVIPGKK